jgi:activating signal cointegrator 1
MKVLSLSEPFASLVREGIKKIETRSWKTNYRGELYIHASLRKINLYDIRINRLVGLLKDKELKYGYIIAKCNLTDCKLMDEKFIEDIKKNKNEYDCGLYEVGRYAWILENVQLIDKKEQVKGQLGIWNYET